MADEVEQITATPKPAPKQAAKEKDPKKVAARRKLAEYNKRAKEALARETERVKISDDVKDDDSSELSEPGGWIPELSFTTVLSLVGIGLTAVELFLRYKGSKSSKPRSQEADRTPDTPPPSKIPVPIVGMN